jgi:hypothetical protein
MQPYRSAQWKAFRGEVIRLDGGACARCGRSASSDVVLQVHHKQYLAGKEPWEYPYELCETLCRGCHAREHAHIMPREGWEAVGVDELGELSGTCELCGTSIRHVFLVEHATWPAMEVGEICCDHLTSTEQASDYIASLRQRRERRKRFVSSCRWYRNGPEHLFIRQRGINVGVVPDGPRFKLTMNGRVGKLQFESVLDAKMKAFDSIESGAVQAFFKHAQTRNSTA